MEPADQVLLQLEPVFEGVLTGQEDEAQVEQPEQVEPEQPEQVEPEQPELEQEQVEQWRGDVLDQPVSEEQLFELG